jgi:uncharacterized protein (TIGR00255 family)
MMLSMTGYGKGEVDWGEGKLQVEIRSLNSKGLDIRCRLPQQLKEQEMHFRRQIRAVGLRGKFDLNVNIMGTQEEAHEIDQRQFRRYYEQIQGLGQELGFEVEETVSSILRIPDVLVSAEEELSEEKARSASGALTLALEKLDAFREEEGRATGLDLQQHVEHILSLLQQVEPFEQERHEQVRERLWKQLSDRLDKGDIDTQRYEEEVLYYLDKLDISEEKVRLQQHCKYFLEQFDSPEREHGKKLNFISQEMGREINTLGSKAQYFEIQQLVVQMKESLEKIKEQVANIV